MIKTIKVKKQFRLDELIKYIFDNDIEDENYYTSEIEHFGRGEVMTGVSKDISLSGYINKDTTFTVEVEEEITQETLLQDVVIIVLNGIKHMPSTVYHSIRSIRRDYPTVTEIHALMNGKLQLIWEAE